MKKIYRDLLGYLYPDRCPVCAGVHPGGLCDKCRAGISFIDRDYCMRCGRPLYDERDEYCPDCRRTARHFVQCRAMLEYKGDIKHSFYRMKSSNKREYAYIYGEEMAAALSGWIRQSKTDLIIPVPLYRKRERERGYNQSGLMAAALGESLGIEVRSDILIRVRDTGSQKALDARQRRENVRDAFAAARAVPSGRRILLIDDVITTGSTLDAAAKCLTDSGACAPFAAAAAAAV